MKTNVFFFFSLIFLFICLLTATGQSIKVTGKVIAANDQAILPGTMVQSLHGQAGTVTDPTGHYTLEVPLGDTLTFSYIGYISQHIPVTTPKLDVMLQEDTSSLIETTVVAYGNYEEPSVQRLSKLSGSMPVGSFRNYSQDRSREQNTEEYAIFQPNRFLSALEQPLSTFSADVDAASYANVRRFINNGSLPVSSAVRTEEMINYFNYNYPAPQQGQPLNIMTEVSTCPWNTTHRLVHIGIKAKEIAREKLPASNLVFLIDVSGSMGYSNKLPLLKSSFRLLLSQLREQDKVAIVTYAGKTEIALPATSGKEKSKILAALEKLEASGYTNGGAGIQMAYQIARENYIPGGNNRVILATDGDFNAGISNEQELEQLIEEKRKSGIFLTVLGYGMGNYKDHKMQILAQKGNGNHAYIDNLNEARKVLVSEFGGTLFTVAKDVKIQVEFNPAQVQAYRLIGYESRQLEKEDFNDDQKDAGEIGCGHSVTALYGVIPAGSQGLVDPLKYQRTSTAQLTDSPELLTVKLQYKLPHQKNSSKLEQSVTDKNLPLIRSSDDFRFSAAVAAFGMLLNHSPYSNGYSYEQVADLAGQAIGKDPEGYRQEFIRLVKNAALLAPQE